MPVLQSIVLTDRTPTTPVNYTFDPVDVVNQVGTVAHAVDGVRFGQKTLTISTKKSGSRYRCRLNLSIPVPNGGSTADIKPILRTGYVNAEFVFDETSTKQERNDAIGMFVSSLAPDKALVNDAIVELQGVSGN